MFYRYSSSGCRISADLDGLFSGSVFILGGNPSLLDLPLDMLRQPGLMTLAMNNVPLSYPRPDLWIGVDKPACFDHRIYADPSIMKFTMISRRNEIAGSTGRPLMAFPNIYFFGTSNVFTYSNFLQPHRDMLWWRSVFPAALQLAFRLGFRKVFLVGCGFAMAGERSYAWETSLTDEQRSYSDRTYNRDLERLCNLKPIFDSHGLEVFSSTPDSLANNILGYVPFDEAIRIALETFPSNKSALIHSSALKH